MKKLFFVLMLIFTTSCVYSQGIVSDLNHMMQVWNNCESLFRRAKNYEKTKMTRYGTIAQYNRNNKLISLTWVNKRIEYWGDYVYICTPGRNEWVRSTAINLSDNRGSCPPFKVIGKWGSGKLREMEVSVIVVSGYVGVEVRTGNGNDRESYGFRK